MKRAELESQFKQEKSGNGQIMTFGSPSFLNSQFQMGYQMESESRAPASGYYSSSVAPSYHNPVGVGGVPNYQSGVTGTQSYQSGATALHGYQTGIGGVQTDQPSFEPSKYPSVMKQSQSSHYQAPTGFTAQRNSSNGQTSYFKMSPITNEEAALFTHEKPPHYQFEDYSQDDHTQLQPSQAPIHEEAVPRPQQAQSSLSLSHRGRPPPEIRRSFDKFEKAEEERNYKERFKQYLERKQESIERDRSIEMLESKVAFDRFECTSPNKKRTKKPYKVVVPKKERSLSGSRIIANNSSDLMLSSGEEADIRRQIIYNIIKSIDKDKTTMISLKEVAGRLAEMEEVYAMLHLDKPFLENALQNRYEKKGGYMSYVEFSDWLNRLIAEKTKSTVDEEAANEVQELGGVDKRFKFILPKEVLDSMQQIFIETDEHEDLVLPRTKFVEALRNDPRLRRYLKKPAVRFQDTGGSLTLQKMLNLIEDEAKRKRDSEEDEHAYYYIDLQQFLGYFLNFQGRNNGLSEEEILPDEAENIQETELDQCEIPDEIFKVIRSCFRSVSEENGYAASIEVLSKVRDEPLLRQILRKTARRTVPALVDSLVDPTLRPPDTETYREVLDRIERMAPDRVTFDEFIGFFSRRGYKEALSDSLVPINIIGGASRKNRTENKKIDMRAQNEKNFKEARESMLKEKLKFNQRNNLNEKEDFVLDGRNPRPENKRTQRESALKKGRRRANSFGDLDYMDKTSDDERGMIEKEKLVESQYEKTGSLERIVGRSSKKVHFAEPYSDEEGISHYARAGTASPRSRSLNKRPKFTVPEPYVFDSRESNKKMSIRARRVETMIEEIKRKESEEFKKRPRAAPLPAHVKMPLYEKFMKERKERSEMIRKEAKAITAQNEKPFNFYYRDKNHQRKFKEDYSFKPVQFQAKPVPWFCKGKGEEWDEIEKQKIKERDERIERMAQESYLKAKLPPRMQKHEQERKVRELQKGIDETGKQTVQYNPELTFHPKISQPPPQMFGQSAIEMKERLATRRFVPSNIDSENSKAYNEKERQRKIEESKGAGLNSSKSQKGNEPRRKELESEIIPKSTKNTLMLMEKRKAERKEREERENERNKDENKREEKKNEMKKVVKNSPAIASYNAHVQNEQMRIQEEARKKKDEEKRKTREEINNRNTKLTERPLLVDAGSSIISFPSPFL